MLGHVMFKVFVHDLKETELLFFIVADNVKKKIEMWRGWGNLT